MPHAYNIKLSARVDKCAYCAFLIAPSANLAQFSQSDIHAKCEHNVTYAFPEGDKYKVHHLTFTPKFVSVDGIANDDSHSATTLQKWKTDRVLRPENVVVYTFRMTKETIAYNQFSTTNIMSVIKHGALPDDNKCEAFLDRKHTWGSFRDGFPDLPQDTLLE